MRKLPYIFLGALIGIALTIGGGAFAASTGLIGKKITGDIAIVLNGQQVAERGSVADGTTLLPVRSLAGLLGAETVYKGGKVYLITKEGDTVSETDGGSQTDMEPQQPSLTAEQIQKKLDNVNHALTIAENALKSSKEVYEGFKNDPKSADQLALYESAYNGDVQAVEKLQQQKSDLEAQLQALQNQ